MASLQKLLVVGVVAYSLFFQFTHSARILGVFIHPVRSNSLFTHAVMSTLASAGHDVTVYSPFQPSADAGFRHVVVHTDFHKAGSGILTYEEIIKNFVGKSGFGWRLFRKVAQIKTESYFKHPLMQQLLYSNDSYDLVFTGAFMGEESTLVFGHLFRSPTIVLMPMATYSTTDYVMGNALSLAFSPEYYAFPFTDKMSLVERMQNVLSATASLLWYHWYDLPQQEEILQRHSSFSSSPPPPLFKMVKNVSLAFVNEHPAIMYPKPLSPNIVHVGGINIIPKKPLLPEDIKIFMDEAKEGVILCSLGSALPVETMPRHLVLAYINAFKNFPQRVIWKMSTNNTPSLPDNVRAYNWLPQQSILDHPNMRVFLTHGGKASQLEALSAGVPVVGVPFLSDQPFNIRLFKNLEVGVELKFSALSEETITTALQTVLNNSRYSENARKVARIFADVPLQPTASVVYWTEYVLRHGGKHLRPQAALLSWYQRALLDVVGFLLAILTSSLAIIVLLTKSFFRWKKREGLKLKKL